MSQIKSGSHRELHFYDAANSHNVPSGVHAAVYINGFAWPQSEIDRMGAVIRISVERDHAWANRARVIDIENGAALPEDAVPFCQERERFLATKSMHVNDSVVYVNRSNRGDVEERLRRAGFTIVVNNIEPGTVRVWEATLDGTDVPDTWACQTFTNGAFDRSILHGVNDFRKP